MKNTILLTAFSAVLLLSACVQENFGRIDQKDDSVPVPSPVTVKSVRSIPGGAVIKVSIPDDDNIKGVIATYVRNGEEVNTKISRFIDSLTVEGFPDTGEHSAKIASFNINEVQSSSVEVKFNPETPSIISTKVGILPSFGGVKVRIEGNKDRQNLAVVILRDSVVSHSTLPMDQIKWQEVTTLFTESDSISLARRGIQSSEAIFGVYLRDRWGNISDTTKAIVTPLEEYQIPKTKTPDFPTALGFSHNREAVYAQDDNYEQTSTNAANYEVAGLWDGSGTSAAHCFFAADSTPIPMWITIDLGCTATLSRIATLPRIAYNIWTNAHPRDFEFWGSMDPTGKPDYDNEHEFDDSWFCLGKFTQFKPSGYEPDGTVGVTTTEDNTYFNNGNDFELDPEAFPHAYDNLRYLRVVIASTFASFEYGYTIGAVQFGEVTPWGQVVLDTE